MHKKTAEISEIFSSIQGEGIFLGARQIFVRFNRCNMNCAFCDEEKNALMKASTLQEVTGKIKAMDIEKGPHHSVSLTGGEPLLYSDFLFELSSALKKERFKTYLETNGTLPIELSKIIDSVDIVAMDFKLPSSTGCREYWAEHLDFLKIASNKKVFVKAVVTPDTVNDDIIKSIELIRSVGDNIPLILQPASSVKRDDKKIDSGRLLEFLNLSAKNNFENIRIIPQVHKALGIK